MKGSVRIRNEKYSYYFKYKDEGGKWRTKEKGGFSTKKAAESALRKAIIDFEENSFVAKSSHYTVKTYFEYWFENIGEMKLKYNTKKLYCITSAKHIFPKLGNIRLTKLTPETLQTFFTDKQKSLGNSTLKAIRNIMNNLLNLAVKQNILKINPMKQVEFFYKANDKKVRGLSKEEVVKVLKHLELKKSRYYTAFLIAIHTGMRRGEILGLTWDCVDFKGSTITVSKQLQVVDKGELVIVGTKTNSSRTIQMTKLLHHYLKKLKVEHVKAREFYAQHYYQEHFFVCQNKDGSPIYPPSLTKCAMNLSKKLGLAFCFHDLRHTHATLMLEADANIKVVQARLGHIDISTTLNIYSHVTKTLEEQTLDKFNDFF